MAIRIAQLADAPAIARVHILTWQIAYHGLLPAALLDNLSLNQRTVEWQEILANGGGHPFVCTHDETIVGFASCGRGRDEDLAEECAGELYAIYLDPAYWQQGYGRALLDTVLAFLETQGYLLVTLWVLAGNQRAIDFYERAGFVADGAIKTETLPGSATVQELRYRRQTSTPRTSFV
jgi:ribosomal protein S18 acetylase RimI-like enzyme